MTAAAAASALICKEQLELLGAPVPGIANEVISGALAHLDTCFDPTLNAGADARTAYLYSYLYCMEIVGDLTGRKQFNGKDWYSCGADYLVHAQDSKGRWTDTTCIEPQDVLGTCFALLFLKRAALPA